MPKHALEALLQHKGQLPNKAVANLEKNLSPASPLPSSKSSQGQSPYSTRVGSHSMNAQSHEESESSHQVSYPAIIPSSTIYPPSPIVPKPVEQEAPNLSSSSQDSYHNVVQSIPESAPSVVLQPIAQEAPSSPSSETKFLGDVLIA